MPTVTLDEPIAAQFVAELSGPIESNTPPPPNEAEPKPEGQQ